MMKYTMIVACLLLSACATPEQIAEQRQLQQQQDVETCRSYGFRPKSDAFSNCMLQLSIAREQRQYYRDNSYYYGGYYGSGYPYRHGGGSLGYVVGY